MNKVLNMGAFGALISRLSMQTDRIFNADQATDIAALVLQAVNVPEVSATRVDLGPLFEAIKTKQKIEAIKQYRMLTGFGLKESKDAVESIWPEAN